MIYFIDELKVIPGVLGASIVRADGAVTATNLPAVFKKERLEQIGNCLVKIYAAGAATFAGFSGLTIHFDESIVIARVIAADALCVVFCDPAYNLNALTMSLDGMQQEIGTQPGTEG